MQSKTFLLCRPSFYEVNYKINPWMLPGSVNQKKALDQWNTLVDRIEEFGGKIRYIRSQEDLPDMIFTANAGLYLPEIKTMVLSNFKFEERQKEQWWFWEFFASEKIQMYIPAHKFEGAGDALFLYETLIGAYGFRSDKEIYDEIRPFLKHDPIVVKLQDPRFYHLDTCFCPLDASHLIYPGAFNKEDLHKINSFGGTIEVPEAEACKFACNSVLVGNKVIIPKGCPVTCKELEIRNYDVIEIDMDEFIKAGGACKCLTLAI